MKSKSTHKKQELTASDPVADGGLKPHRRIGRLNTAEDVKKFMAKCIKSAARGVVPRTQYNLVTMASQLLKAIEVANLEARIEQLEKNKERK